MGARMSGDVRPQAWSSPVREPKLVLQFAKGLNENISPTIQECTEGYNFPLSFADSSLRVRPPFDLKGTAPNAGAIGGIMQMVKRDGTETTLVAANDTVYQWDGGGGFTSKASIVAGGHLREAYWSLGDYLVITDVTLQNVVKKWDGTTFGDLSTGLGSALYAKYAIVHQNRVWLFNIVSGTTPLPHMILACKFEDPTTWDTTLRGGASTVGGGTFTTGLEAFYLLTPDLRPINGVALIQNTLTISTDKGRMWQLTGTSGKDFQFTDFYDTDPAIGTESVANIGNDVVYVRKGGSVALLSATQAFGSVFASNMSSWIPVSTQYLASVTQVVYDVEQQRVFFFSPNRVFVLYKDLLAQDRYSVEGQPSPWSLWTTLHPNGFGTSAARYILQPGTSTYSVIWGDSTGNLFDMNGVGTSGDAGVYPISMLRRSIHIVPPMVDPWPWTEENIACRLNYRRLSVAQVNVVFDWDDEYSTTASQLNLKAPAASDPSASYFGGPVYFGGAAYFGSGFEEIGFRPSSINFEPGGKGPGFYVSIFSQGDSSMQIDSLVLDN